MSSKRCVMFPMFRLILFTVVYDDDFWNLKLLQHDST